MSEAPSAPIVRKYAELGASGQATPSAYSIHKCRDIPDPLRLIDELARAVRLRLLPLRAAIATLSLWTLDADRAGEIAGLDPSDVQSWLWDALAERVAHPGAVA